MKAHISKNYGFDDEFERGYNPRLKAAVLEVVDNQLTDNDPPITRITLDRLMKAGYTEEQAKEKIAAVVAVQIYDIMKYSKTYDEEKYSRELSKLK